MARKTVSLHTVIDRLNTLIESADTEKEQKRLCTMAEDLLFLADQYRGYANLYWMKVGFQHWTDDGRPEDKTKYYGPEYQRFYYLPPQ